MKKPNLCWECKRQRVLSGLQNAKAKGKRIGRERKRNDALIHSLLEAGLSFREISRIARCSHDSVSASKRELLEKKAALKTQNEKQDSKSDSVMDDFDENKVPPCPAIT